MHSGLWQAVRPADLWVHGLIVETLGDDLEQALKGLKRPVRASAALALAAVHDMDLTIGVANKRLLDPLGHEPTFGPTSVHEAVPQFERGVSEPRRAILAALRRSLEQAGVRFIGANKGGGPGVRLREDRQ